MLSNLAAVCQQRSVGTVWNVFQSLVNKIKENKDLERQVTNTQDLPAVENDDSGIADNSLQDSYEEIGHENVEVTTFGDLQTVDDGDDSAIAIVSSGNSLQDSYEESDHEICDFSSINSEEVIILGDDNVYEDCQDKIVIEEDVDIDDFKNDDDVYEDCHEVAVPDDGELFEDCHQEIFEDCQEFDVELSNVVHHDTEETIQSKYVKIIEVETRNQEKINLLSAIEVRLSDRIKSLESELSNNCCELSVRCSRERELQDLLNVEQQKNIKLEKENKQLCDDMRFWVKRIKIMSFFLFVLLLCISMYSCFRYIQTKQSLNGFKNSTKAVNVDGDHEYGERSNGFQVTIRPQSSDLMI